MKFRGFTKETTRFLSSLKKNNKKEWFEKNRSVYNDQVLDPARMFTVELGARLTKIAPGIHAEPQIDKSIFRFHRDVRFSADKSPYKSHLGIFLWEGTGKKMENSGFYFHLEPPNLMLGVGLYMFPRHLLEPYRKRVSHSNHGKSLVNAVQKIQKKKLYTIGGEHYKRVPAGFNPTGLGEQLIKHNGLFASIEMPIPEELYSPKIVGYCFNHFKAMLPLHTWLLDMTEIS